MISNNSKLALLNLHTSFMTLTCEIIHSLITIKSQMYVLREIIIIFTWTSVFLLCDSLHDSTSTQLSLIDHDFHQNVNRPTTKNHIEENSLTSYPKSKMLQPYSKYGNADLFKPIRILPFYSFDEQLLPEEKEALQRVIEKAVRKISKLLSVIRLTSPLLLPRSECPAIFGVGINKGKCARIPKGYNGEICLDNFKIPNAHLQSFIIYNKTSPEPIYVYRDGQGIQNVDYVLYVTSQTTEYCNPYKASAIAYASACQLDGVDRPLAGQVNFCPRTVKAQKFDQEVLYK